jgi:hypothetical protein
LSCSYVILINGYCLRWNRVKSINTLCGNILVFLSVEAGDTSVISILLGVYQTEHSVCSNLFIFQTHSRERNKQNEYSINYVISFATWQTCRMHTVFFLLSITRQLSLWNTVRIPITDTLHRSQLLRKPSLLCCSQNVKSSCYALACKSPAAIMNVFQWDSLWITKAYTYRTTAFQICLNIKRALLPAVRGIARRCINSRFCTITLHVYRQNLDSSACLWVSEFIYALY